ncbi:hypothetical protein PVE90_28425, partial [Pseudomonas carnis]|nr:hypothetical protein [Pseudomonas carnis]
MAWVSVLFLFLEQMLSLTFCQKLTSNSDLCKPPLVGLGQKCGSWLACDGAVSVYLSGPDTPP